MKNIKLIVLAVLVACNSIYEDEIVENAQPGLPVGFDYKTTTKGVLTVLVQDNNAIGLSEVPLSIYTAYKGSKSLLVNGQTSSSGIFQFSSEIGNHVDSLVIETDYLGVPSTTSVTVNSQMNVVIGGKPSYELNGEFDATSNAINGRTSNTPSYLGSYDSNGVPYYLEPVDDYISQDILDLVNNSLPEGYPVPTYNPEYIVDSVSSDTHLRDSADVWVTFVHEGAGWRNTLGYYTYNINNPPASVDDIDELKIIFPNVSFLGGGGGLESGNKVYLGKFPGNTGIGWFLIPQGWTGSQASFRNDVKFSNKDFNTFTPDPFRTHTVLLKDNTRELLLLGMEDITRPGGDNDFNDAVFYVTANPFSAIVTTSLQETTTDELPDADGDGVADKNDDYPNDPDRAFDIYTPGKNIFGSLGFEDLYPSKGDFDMNDLVIDYNFQAVANVSNRIVELRAQFKLKALGAMIHSGYGFTLPVSPSLINSITGQNVIADGEEIVLNANGTESGQTNAVILLFEDAFRIWNGAYGRTNTISSNDFIEPVEIDLVITFTEPVSSLELGYAPYDPFIFHSEDRSLEVHLSNGSPTDLASFTLTGADDRGEGSNYKTYDNLPYAIHLPIEFDYPEEEQSMSDAFLHFEEWARSLNTEYVDWYVDKTGYRVTNKIYAKD